MVRANPHSAEGIWFHCAMIRVSRCPPACLPISKNLRGGKPGVKALRRKELANPPRNAGALDGTQE